MAGISVAPVLLERGSFIRALKGLVVNKLLKLAAILFIVTSLTTGCANHSTGSVNSLTNLSSLKTMYVKKFPSDNSGVYEQIADKLRSKGVTVTTGTEVPPNNIDAVVTYVDRWMWDITMYMLELTITIRDPKTEAQMAIGNSLHTSLTRKSQTEMVDEVVNSIYNSSSKGVSETAVNIAAATPSVVSTSTIKTPTESSAPQKIRELLALKKEGVITESEFQEKKNKLLEQY